MKYINNNGNKSVGQPVDIQVLWIVLERVCYIVKVVMV